MFEAENHCLSFSSLVMSLFLFVFFSIDVESQEVCNETLTGCCPGYMWNNKNSKCEPCMPGSTGINCSTICPFPSYGYACQNDCNCIESMCNVSTGCEPMPAEKRYFMETTNIENATYHITAPSIFGKSFNPSLSKAYEILPLFIKMIGGIDIILLAAYVAMLIYDRKRREKAAKFSSSDQHTSIHNTAYENIIVV